jgi:predicted nucleic acid-binding protein
MARRILDTNVLVGHFRKQRLRTPAAARAHAKRLVEIEATNLILSPVSIEFLGGARSGSELAICQAFLAPFEVLDKRSIPAGDWKEAERIAKWVRDEGRPRKLGDCLIAAIAKRLKAEVVTSDRDFRSRIPPR